MISNYRINLTGCSGIGKTTLALAIAKQYGLKFVSGSYSDLVPVTKNMPHSEMIQQDAKTIFEQDVQVLNARRKAFDMYEALVSDRSYIDSAAYMIQKLSHRLPTCEIEDFIEKCRVLTLSQCGKVIYVPYTKEHFTKWNIEDNGKRVLNKFYQAEVSAIIDWLIESYWECEFISTIMGKTDNPIFRLYDQEDHGLYTDILVLKEIPHEDRMAVINRFIKKSY